MKIAYIPGLPLRFFPGTTRTLSAGLPATEVNAKIALFTGNAPTEDDLKQIVNYEQYLLDNAATLVYKEETVLSFKYEGMSHRRIIQREPKDSTTFTNLVDSVPESETLIPGQIPTKFGLWTMVYVPDLDATLNVENNDLILIIPGVGIDNDSTVSVSNETFLAGEENVFRNLTISLFQGYQITDNVIYETQDDPDNIGETIEVPVATTKTLYYNNVWANRISESYRDCIISKMQDTTPNYLFRTTGNAAVTYTTQTLQADGSTFASSYATTGYTPSRQRFLVNQAFIDILSEINRRSITRTLPKWSEVISNSPVNDNNTCIGYTTQSRANGYESTAGYPHYDTEDHIVSLLSFLLLQKAETKYTLGSTSPFDAAMDFLVVKMGFDSSLIERARKCVIPMDFSINDFISDYSKETGILTIQNEQPSKLYERYQQTVHNPTNEQLYLVFNKFSYNSRDIEQRDQTGLEASYHVKRDSVDTISFPTTQKVVSGQPITNEDQRVRLINFTALSIGETGNGNTDIEYDFLDTIDYIDSLTTMFKVPNKF